MFASGYGMKACGTLPQACYGASRSHVNARRVSAAPETRGSFDPGETIPAALHRGSLEQPGGV